MNEMNSIAWNQSTKADTSDITLPFSHVKLKSLKASVDLTRRRMLNFEDDPTRFRYDFRSSSLPHKNKKNSKGTNRYRFVLPCDKNSKKVRKTGETQVQSQKWNSSTRVNVNDRKIWEQDSCLYLKKTIEKKKSISIDRFKGNSTQRPKTSAGTRLPRKSLFDLQTEYSSVMKESRSESLLDSRKNARLPLGEHDILKKRCSLRAMVRKSFPKSSSLDGLPYQRKIERIRDHGWNYNSPFYRLIKTE